MKNYKKRKDIENNVLKIYRKVSPSHRNLINIKSKKQFFDQRLNLFQTLGFPISFFEKKNILEIEKIISNMNQQIKKFQECPLLQYGERQLVEV